MLSEVAFICFGPWQVYILKAEDVYHRYLRKDGTLPYDAVIVINDRSPNVTQPRPFDWDQQLQSPSLVPVVTVSNSFRALLKTATELNLLQLLGDHQILRSRNVLAKLKPTPGCSPTRPLYLGTPINGFFRAACERGAGIALLIELARMFANRAGCTKWQVIFAFTSGHEQGDPGISIGAIPFLRNLSRSQKLSLNEVPFISIGADLGAFARFEGPNFEGHGTLPVLATSTAGDREAVALLDEMLSHLRHLSFVHTSPGKLNVTNSQGAIQQALRLGMPAMSLKLHGAGWKTLWFLFGPVYPKFCRNLGLSW